MVSELLISKDSLFTKIALFEDKRLVEYYLEEKNENKIVGNIYLGKIDRVLPGVDCAFVDIGIGKDGFLYKGDILLTGGNGKKGFSWNNLKVGDEIIVQVTKEQFGNKGPRLTTAISIPGNLLVFIPQADKIGVSKKIPHEESERLRELLLNIKKDFKGGFIIRTSAQGSTKEDLASEMQNLVELWNFILLKKKYVRAPSLLYQELDLPLKAVREIILRTKGEVIVDDEEILKKINRLLETIPGNSIELKFWDREKPLFDEYGVEKELEKALKAKIQLPSGGFIVIQPTEALVAIDVNSGRFIGKESLEDTAFKTNLEAAEEIVRQLRLRNLGGIIVIDFIDMQEKKHKEELLAALMEYLKKDKAKSRITKISEFGLVEMTRKRTQISLDKMFYSICPCCDGKGRIDAPWRIVLTIKKQLREISPSKTYLLRVSSYVKKFIDLNRELLDFPKNVLIEEFPVKDPTAFEILRIMERARVEF